ncbi:MAG: haloacid dehalogenase-like hydrolase [Desulfobacterales bacterium]|nr:MAG: haloacid dehalogenase-like hydrolase [Desulfobacterales bacterium]
MEKLVLFDIDGTLIDSGAAGSRSWNQAFWSTFAIRDALKGIQMDGKTDIQILREGMAAHGLTLDDSLLLEITTRYLENLRSEIENPAAHIQPGVMALLNFLDANDKYAVGLLTGNLESGARIKLDPFGLNQYFALGAFGSDHEDRNRLLPIAVEKYKKMSGEKIRYEDCVVIGDTPRDVQCAQPYRAQTIAVATGNYTYDSLLVTSADYVIQNLRQAIPLFDI